MKKGKLAAKTSTYLSWKYFFFLTSEDRQEVYWRHSKGKNTFKVQIFLCRKPKKGESAVKKKQVNCSFKMFLLLTVWYEEGGKEPRGNH